MIRWSRWLVILAAVVAAAMVGLEFAKEKPGRSPGGDAQEETIESSPGAGAAAGMCLPGEEIQSEESSARWNLRTLPKEESKEGADDAQPSVLAVPPETILTEDEQWLLHELYHYMEKKDLAEAARILNERGAELSEMVSGSMAGKRYLYFEETEGDGTKREYLEEMSDETRGRGLALTRFNTAFFGKFSGGKPEGRGTAIQAMVLDGARYTYAEGIWREGKLNGHGRTGYRYCGEAPEGSFAATGKTGYYVDNLLDGEMVYRVESKGGESYRWRIMTENGVTVLDDRWTKDPWSGDWLLAAEENPDRAYVLAADRADQILWVNLIVWEK